MFYSKEFGITLDNKDGIIRLVWVSRSPAAVQHILPLGNHRDAREFLYILNSWLRSDSVLADINDIDRNTFRANAFLYDDKPVDLDF